MKDGAGKRRLFAIGNYIKQRLLRPVHDWAMSVLRTLPMDGTFNQEGPIHRLLQTWDGKSTFYCYDLKSATDRWPLSVIHEVVSSLFGPTVASCIVNGTLGLNTFDIRGLINKSLRGRPRPPQLVSFVTGQPLGYYSSWSLFSLSHHWLVWTAAELAYPGKTGPFNQYAILGDDIVIADDRVAYNDLLNKLGVTISKRINIE